MRLTIDILSIVLVTMIELTNTNVSETGLVNMIGKLIIGWIKKNNLNKLTLVDLIITMRIDLFNQKKNIMKYNHDDAIIMIRP